MNGDLCPHCGSEDYGPVNEGNEHACLTCGYDTENGTLGVCPGGKHPRDGQVCCDTCWNAPPRNLPGQPRWRSRRRSLMARRSKPDHVWLELEAIDKALVAWLRAHQSDDRPHYPLPGRPREARNP